MVNMTDCSINENHASDSGGGMYILGEANLLRCHIHDNVALDAPGSTSRGAGLSVHDGTATIFDSDIYQNRAAIAVEYAFRN